MGLSLYPESAGLRLVSITGDRGATLNIQVPLSVGVLGLTGDPNSVVRVFAYQITTSARQPICAGTSSVNSKKIVPHLKLYFNQILYILWNVVSHSKPLHLFNIKIP